MMLSTVDWAGELSSEYHTDSEATTTSTQWTSTTTNSMLAIKTAVAFVGYLGTVTNGLVLVGFWLSDRSKLNTSSILIANHTTLEQSTLLWCWTVFNNCHFLDLSSIWSGHTTLELFGCVMIASRYTMDVAGVFDYYQSSGPGAMTLCVVVDGGTLITLGLNGGTASLVVHTLDRYWKIVYPIHHRKFYRRWMLYVGLFLPWLYGTASHLLPAIGTTKIVNGVCHPIAFWPSPAMEKVCSSIVFLMDLSLRVI